MLISLEIEEPKIRDHSFLSPQDAQKGCPARPQRVKGRGVPSGYVEGLNDARTPLADFFSIMLTQTKEISWQFRYSI
jgi:hypothetical protein